MSDRNKNDENELGKRAAKAIKLENQSKGHTRAVISGRGITASLRRPAGSNGTKIVNGVWSRRLGYNRTRRLRTAAGRQGHIWPYPRCAQGIAREIARTRTEVNDNART
jgi:hypothetical protein